ncbi:MAG: IPT/TIG domain-containing protein, partial [Terriglobales bacterium]
ITLTAMQPFSVLPTCKSLSPKSGSVGSEVTIVGSGFDQTTGVSFIDGVAASFTVVSDTEITATVPAGAKTGSITITTKGGSVVSKTVFKVE